MPTQRAPDPRQTTPGLRGGSRRVFKRFAWLEVDSDKTALSRPAHQQVTPAVSWLGISKNRMVLKDHLMQAFWSIVFSILLVACSTSSEIIIPSKIPSIVPTPTALLVYRDVTNRFELTYSPSDFQIASDKLPCVAVDFLLNLEDDFAGKNLEEVRVSIAVNPECYFVREDGFKESASINGIDFTKYSERNSGSKSNVFETITYQTTHNDNNYEIQINIREYRLDRFLDLTEYSRTLLDTKLDSLIKTFKFLE